MANRQLTAKELERIFTPLLESVRAQLSHATKGDEALLRALRRKLAKELSHDERSRPDERKKLKEQKRREQNNLCAACGKALPEKYAALSRIEAMKGYTAENTRLVCASCDVRVQKERGYN